MLNFLFQSGFFLKKLYFYSSSMQKNVFMTLAPISALILRTNLGILRGILYICIRNKNNTKRL